MNHTSDDLSSMESQHPEQRPNKEDASTSPATAHTDTLPSLEEQLRIVELEAAEHHDAWLRAKADLENMRRRAAEDIAKASKYAIEKFAIELLSVKDSLEQALAVDNVSIETLREGVELTLRNLTKAFEKGGIEEIDPLGQKFDPHKHQAMAAQESDQAPNTVLQVFQKGYQLENRVIRPAMVTVAKANN